MTMDKFLYKLVPKEVWKTYYEPSYTEVKFAKPVTRRYSISLCTNCMGRAEDVKRTFIQNIEDNKDYRPHIEFVLLNYGSKDDLDEWAYQNLVPYMKEGIVNYYKTEEPQFYSMTHSRNITFRLACGDIVNNVDADHFTKHGFATRINQIANQFDHEKVVFVKSHQKNRGRVGMFKSRFLTLGGYDEAIKGYGYDDLDLVLRAYHSGFSVVKFGGEFMELSEHHERHKSGNYEIEDWRYTQRRNALISLLNIYSGRLVSNEDKEWGGANLVHNFSRCISI